MKSITIGLVLIFLGMMHLIRFAHTYEHDSWIYHPINGVILIWAGLVSFVMLMEHICAQYNRICTFAMIGVCLILSISAYILHKKYMEYHLHPDRSIVIKVEIKDVYKHRARTGNERYFIEYTSEGKFIRHVFETKANRYEKGDSVTIRHSIDIPDNFQVILSN